MDADQLARLNTRQASQNLTGANAQIGDAVSRGDYAAVVREARNAVHYTVLLSLWGRVADYGWNAATTRAMEVLTEAVAEIENDVHAPTRAQAARSFIREAARHADHSAVAEAVGA